MTVLSQQDRTSLIRYQNDLFRQMFTGGVVTITSGIAALCEEVRADMILKPGRRRRRTTSGKRWRSTATKSVSLQRSTRSGIFGASPITIWLEVRVLPAPPDFNSQAIVRHHPRHEVDNPRRPGYPSLS